MFKEIAVSVFSVTALKGILTPQPVPKMMAVLATIMSLRLVKSDFTWYCSVRLKESIVFRITVEEH